MDSQEITLAIDAMGGDHAPQAVVKGAAIALRLDADLRLILVGDAGKLRPLLAHEGIGDRTRIVHTDAVVASEEIPSQALRSGKNSSMRLALDLVKSGEASAIVSAGNSGALMVKALMVLRQIEGIERPALAAWLPTRQEPCCMLDLGANIDCDATNLVQFAAMGEAFYRVLQDVASPRIGLLNVGIEAQKGSASIREAAAILSDAQLKMNYIGFIEGDAIPEGAVNVVVSDGFSGNVALKTAEGTSRFIGSLIRDAFGASLSARLGYVLARRSFRKLRDTMNPQHYNGAVLLGLNGIVVKSHGSANHEGFASAIKVASDLHRRGFINDLKAGLSRSMAAIEAAQATAQKGQEKEK